MNNNTGDVSIAINNNAGLDVAVFSNNATRDVEIRGNCNASNNLSVLGTNAFGNTVNLTTPSQGGGHLRTIVSTTGMKHLSDIIIVVIHVLLLLVIYGFVT